MRGMPSPAPFTPHDLNVVVGQQALYHVCPHRDRSMTGWATLWMSEAAMERHNAEVELVRTRRLV